MGPKRKSARQVRYLLSSGSPLTDEQQNKLKGELHSGAVVMGKAPDAPGKKKRGTK